MNIQQKRILDLFYGKSVRFKGFDLYFTNFYKTYGSSTETIYEELINLFINNYYSFKTRCLILAKDKNYSRGYMYDSYCTIDKEIWRARRYNKPGKRNNGDKFDDSKFLDLISKIFKELEDNRTFYINELKKVLLLK